VHKGKEIQNTSNYKISSRSLVWKSYLKKINYLYLERVVTTFLVSTFPRGAVYRIKGFLVDIKDTIKGFNMIIDGELDHLPESAFNLRYNRNNRSGEKMLAEMHSLRFKV
jgi:hypothetical protein